jgi:hypothetical protein
VGQVHGVAGLEGHCLFPAALAHLLAQLDRGAEGVGEVAREIGIVEHLDGARDQGVAGRFEGRHPGMGLVAGAEDLLDDHPLILGRKGFEVAHLLDGDHRLTRHIGIAQGQAGTYLHPGRQLGPERDIDHRHRP